MYNLTTLTLNEVVAIGDALRGLADGMRTMEEVAGRVTHYLYDHCLDSSGERACALVRFYKTHAYGGLPPELQRIARAALSDATPEAQTRCLTLLATAGDLPAWNQRRDSAGHQVIPLASRQMVDRLPMVAQLVHQLGITVSSVLSPDSDLIMEPGTSTHNVFYVAEALGSPAIPAQEEFVIPHGIRTVLGVGSLITARDLFAVILFSKAPVDVRRARVLSHLAFSINSALIRFTSQSVFAAE